MSLPPERISIKRRRQEEPVETLFLEDKAVHSSKRRFTDFIFQRIRNSKDNSELVTASKTQTADSVAGKQTAASKRLDDIPHVRTSAPGDEIRDFENYRAKQRQPTGTPVPQTHTSVNSQVSSAGLTAVSSPTLPWLAKGARRFHLTRDISSVLRPNSSGGIRRRKLNLRPPIATFVEHDSTQRPRQTGPISQKLPLDRIVHLSKDQPDASCGSPAPESIVARTPLDTFFKTTSPPTKRGHSIRDDPSTWDLQSDQLANELASLALELDPDTNLEEGEQRVPQVREEIPVPTVSDMAMFPDDDDDEYVFETYVRIRQNDDSAISPSRLGLDFGVLVIDEEDEDLWERYIQSDDEDDWDEEDEDSNAEDNPRNDYPEDEVSSDDEYGTQVYKYRNNASDDEEYDNERDEL